MFICADAVFAAYEEPELEITSQPDYIVVGQTAEIKLEIIHPIDGVLYNGSFKIKGTKTGTQTFSGKKVTINYHLYFPNGGWHWKSATFTPEVTLDVVGIKSITVSKKVGLVGKECTVTGQTEPAGYEDLIEWEASGTGENFTGKGQNFSFTPSNKGNYTIKNKIGISSMETNYTAIKAIFYPKEKSENYIIEKEVEGNKNLSLIQFHNYIIQTEPPANIKEIIGAGKINIPFVADISVYNVDIAGLGSLIYWLSSFIPNPTASVKCELKIFGDYIFSNKYGPETIISCKGTNYFIFINNNLNINWSGEANLKERQPTDTFLSGSGNAILTFETQNYDYARSFINNLIFGPPEISFCIDDILL